MNIINNQFFEDFERDEKLLRALELSKVVNFENSHGLVNIQTHIRKLWLLLRSSAHTSDSVVFSLLHHKPRSVQIINFHGTESFLLIHYSLQHSRIVQLLRDERRDGSGQVSVNHPPYRCVCWAASAGIVQVQRQAIMECQYSQTARTSASPVALLPEHGEHHDVDNLNHSCIT